MLRVTVQFLRKHDQSIQRRMEKHHATFRDQDEPETNRRKIGKIRIKEVTRIILRVKLSGRSNATTMDDWLNHTSDVYTTLTMQPTSRCSSKHPQTRPDRTP